MDREGKGSTDLSEESMDEEAAASDEKIFRSNGACDDESRSGEFTVIGSVIPLQLPPVEARDPPWVRNAVTFPKNLSETKDLSHLEHCEMSPQVMARLRELSFNRLFPVQWTVLPILVQCLRFSGLVRPPDVCVASPTGSGKTLTYVIPIVNHLNEMLQSQLRVLVLVPVAELADQVKKVFVQVIHKSHLKVYSSAGTQSLSKDVAFFDEARVLPDIVITTPGRLVDLIMRSPGFDLKNLQLIVFDEADRLENNELEGQWLQVIDKAVYKDPAKYCNRPCPCDIAPDDLANTDIRISFDYTDPCGKAAYCESRRPIMKWLFSATLSCDPIKLENLSLFNPRLIRASSHGDAQVEKISRPQNLTEQMIVVEESLKPLLVWYLLVEEKMRRVICFTGSIENTHRLYLLLSQIPNLSVTELSSHCHRRKRSNKLKSFTCGACDLLVCSDLMARGLDVKDVNFVINYDVPTSETSYVHRIGRTARAGQSGTAITLVTGKQKGRFKAMVRKAYEIPKGSPVSRYISTVTVDRESLEHYFPAYESALNKLKRRVRHEASRSLISLVPSHSSSSSSSPPLKTHL